MGEPLTRRATLPASLAGTACCSRPRATGATPADSRHQGLQPSPRGRPQGTNGSSPARAGDLRERTAPAPPALERLQERSAPARLVLGRWLAGATTMNSPRR